MRVQPLGHDDAIDGAVGLQEDLALGQIEVERIALVAGALHRGIGGVKRFQDRSEQGTGGIVGMTVDRGLRLRVMSLAAERIRMR